MTKTIWDASGIQLQSVKSRAVNASGTAVMRNMNFLSQSKMVILTLQVQKADTSSQLKFKQFWNLHKPRMCFKIELYWGWLTTVYLSTYCMGLVPERPLPFIIIIMCNQIYSVLQQPFYCFPRREYSEVVYHSVRLFSLPKARKASSTCRRHCKVSNSHLLVLQPDI